MLVHVAKGRQEERRRAMDGEVLGSHSKMTTASNDISMMCVERCVLALLLP